MKQFFYTRFDKGEKYSGFQIGWLGYAFEIRKWPSRKKYQVWRYMNAIRIIILNVSFKFIYPLNKNLKQLN